ncbi:glycoside hydrolase family 38 N-terminal domain-containing protein [Aestuariimicrobium sp. T2.26MG-19.2B]|uniref:glycoside hydrolase family 38 N-terminal domain-containing protein n=1 Tax=Aestuariimicrobium sp. T2.26MG-19.2B TaxID=3040679 RepID=UPI00406CF17E
MDAHGTARPPTVMAGLVRIIDVDVDSFWRKVQWLFSASLEVVRHAPNSGGALQDMLADSLAHIDWPREARAYLHYAAHDEALGRLLFDSPVSHMTESWASSDGKRPAVSVARAAHALQAIPQYEALRVDVTGYSHIDAEWLWPRSVTERLVPAHHGWVPALMHRYPQITWVLASAWELSILAAKSPDLYEMVRDLIRIGRIEFANGLYNEPDVLQLHGETTMRALALHRDTAVAMELPVSTLAWLPDSFGFPQQMPQMLRLAGCSSFYTGKLHSSDPAFPHHRFAWQSANGVEVRAIASLGEDAYNGILDPAKLIRYAGGLGGRLFQPLGSSGGSGPTLTQLASWKSAGEAGPVTVHWTSPSLLFEAADWSTHSVHRGPLELGYHQGTWVTQARYKRLLQGVEDRLLTCEKVLLFKQHMGYPNHHHHRRLQSLWRQLADVCTHDLVGGSCSGPVQQRAYRSLLRIDRILSSIFTAVKRQRRHTSGVMRRWTLNYSSVQSHGPDSVGAMSACIRLDDSPSALECNSEPSAVFMGALAAMLPTPVSFDDRTGYSDAWELGYNWESSELDPWVLDRSVSTPVGLSQTWSWGHSTVTLTIRPGDQAGCFRVTAYLRWFERRTLLGFLWKLTTSGTSLLRADAPFGVDLHPLRVGELPKVVVARAFIDLETAGAGLLLGASGSHAFHVSADMVTHLAVRGAVFPDPLADIGNHTIEYTIVADSGTFLDRWSVYERSRHPMVHWVDRWAPGRPTRYAPLEPIPRGVACSSLRVGDDDMIVARLFEFGGGAGAAPRNFECVEFSAGDIFDVPLVEGGARDA